MSTLSLNRRDAIFASMYGMDYRSALGALEWGGPRGEAVSEYVVTHFINGDTAVVNPVTVLTVAEVMTEEGMDLLAIYALSRPESPQEVREAAEEWLTLISTTRLSDLLSVVLAVR